MSKAWIKRFLMGSGLTRLVAQISGRKGAAILMYHSVMDEPSHHQNTLGGIIHSTREFRSQMELLARNYVPVPLDDVLRFVQGEKELSARAVVVTFDDGYADNYEVALPVLDQVGVPATFYVTVDCIETAKLPWPSRLRYAFFTTKKKSWRGRNGESWLLEDAERRNHAFLQACDDCAKLAGDRQEQFVQSAERELEAGPPQFAEPLMMNWGQVQGLIKKGHLVGSHTMTHPNVAYVETAEARAELSNSKRRLEEVLRAPVIHFSYPCPALTPHWKAQTVAMTRELGYLTGVTTDGGLVSQQDDPLCLHRIRPTKEVDGLKWNLECTFLGRTM